MVSSAVQDLLDAQGLTAADIPLGIVMYNVASLGFAAVTWAALYHYSPHHATISRFAEAHAEHRMVIGLRSTYDASIQWAERRINSMGGHENARRLATSFAESNVLRKIIKPLTVPPKLWIAASLVRASPWRGGGDAERESRGARGDNNGGRMGKSGGRRIKQSRRAAICRPGIGC